MADLYMRFPGGRARALTLSYDDGVQQDKKLMEILNHHGLKCTFNISSGLYAAEGTVYEEGRIHRRMTKSEALALYTDSGHEIAVHGLTHPWLEKLPLPVCVREIIEDRENLEAEYGGTVRGMAYPYGTYNDDVVSVLRNCGICYSRTVHSTERFDIPNDWLRLPATCHHDNPRLMELAKNFLEQPSWGAPWMFYLWGHSYEFEAGNNWNVIEEFAEYMGGREEVWYATNIEIYDYVKAYKQLNFNAAMTYVENPTAYELWFETNGKLYSVKPGESLKLA